jgi:hypothetical protein
MSYTKKQVEVAKRALEVACYEKALWLGYDKAYVDRLSDAEIKKLIGESILTGIKKMIKAFLDDGLLAEELLDYDSI